jgi:hypothetical protein
MANPTIHIGPWTYELRITGGKIVSQGFECNAATLEDARVILISGECPPEGRLRLVARQALMAWIYAVGTPEGIANWCDLFATFFKSLSDDLERMGGVKGLENLKYETPT